MGRAAEAEGSQAMNDDLQATADLRNAELLALDQKRAWFVRGGELVLLPFKAATSAELRHLEDVIQRAIAMFKAELKRRWP